MTLKQNFKELLRKGPRLNDIRTSWHRLVRNHATERRFKAIYEICLPGSKPEREHILQEFQDQCTGSSALISTNVRAMHQLQSYLQSPSPEKKDELIASFEQMLTQLGAVTAEVHKCMVLTEITFHSFEERKRKHERRMEESQTPR